MDICKPNLQRLAVITGHVRSHFGVRFVALKLICCLKLSLAMKVDRIETKKAEKEREKAQKAAQREQEKVVKGKKDATNSARYLLNLHFSTQSSGKLIIKWHQRSHVNTGRHISPFCKLRIWQLPTYWSPCMSEKCISCVTTGHKRPCMLSCRGGIAEMSKATGKEQGGPLDDRELAGCDLQPPPPKPIPGCQDLPASLIPGQSHTWKWANQEDCQGHYALVSSHSCLLRNGCFVRHKVASAACRSPTFALSDHISSHEVFERSCTGPLDLHA